MDSKISVLQLVAHGPADPHTGQRSTNGPEVRALQSLKFYSYDAFRFVVAYSSEGRLYDKFTENKAVQTIPFAVRGKFNFSAILNIFRIIRAQGIDVVHTQGPGSLDFFASIACQFCGVPHVVTRPSILDGLSLRPVIRNIYRLIDAYTFMKAAAIVAVSNNGMQAIRERYNVSVARLHLIHNGVDVDCFLPSAGKKTGDTVVIGTNAQMTIYKGWPDYLSVVKDISGMFPSAKFLLVGDGPLRKSVHAMAIDMGISDRIEWAGYQPDVRPFLSKMDIYFLSSWVEGFPVSILEAMSCGLPVVATNVGGVNEAIIHGDTGFVAEPRQPGELVKLLARLVKDEELRKSYGAAGRNRVVNNFSILSMVSKYETLYRAVLRSA